jgi:hypothetical protein
VGSDVPTPLTYKFKSDNISEEPTAAVVNGEGDGVVNKESLDLCLQWSGNSSFHYRAFKGIGHIDMVRNLSVLEVIADIL